MTQTDEKEKTTQQAGMGCSPEACFQMMSKAMPYCCTPQMREKLLGGLPEDCRTKMGEMMSRFFARTEKGSEEAAKEA